MSRHLLVIAEPLLAEGLGRLIGETYPGDRVSTDPSAVDSTVALVLWFPNATITAEALTHESQHLQERWDPALLLIVLPGELSFRNEQLLALPATGLLQAPSSRDLLDSIETLLQGGRVLALNDDASVLEGERSAAAQAMAPLGLGQWLLRSGLQQIDAELQRCAQLLQAPRQPLLLVLVLQGRRRELLAARQLLLLLWGPVSLAWGHPAPPESVTAAAGLSLSLSQRNADGAWLAISERLRQRIAAGLNNNSGQLLALEALHPERRSDLLLTLLDQLQTLRRQLHNAPVQPQELREQWFSLQGELRQQALRRMASPYVRLPFNGELRPVAETLIRSCDLEGSDPELPDPQAMLQTLVLGQPLLVDGQLLAPDAPLAVLRLEKLLSNWLLRTADQISAEVLASCSAWPELRRYLLVSPLLSTRNLERVRNQLNAQQRWSTWMERPIDIYESRRQLLTLTGETITVEALTEPRDNELAQLGWGQQLVTLALETRDALGPQLQSLIQAIGRLVVLVLTQVLGRAIGLVGRGIVQGMGRTLQRD